MLSHLERRLLNVFLARKDVISAFNVLSISAKLLRYFMLQLDNETQLILNDELKITADKIPSISADEAAILDTVFKVCYLEQGGNLQKIIHEAFVSRLSEKSISSIYDLEIELTDNHVRTLIANVCSYFYSRFSNILAFWAAKQLNKDFKALEQEDHLRYIAPYRMLMKALSVHAKKVNKTELLILDKKPMGPDYYSSQADEVRQIHQGTLVIYPENDQWISCLIAGQNPASSQNAHQETSAHAVRLIEKYSKCPLSTNDLPQKIKLSGFFNTAKTKILEYESKFIIENRPYADLLDTYPTLDATLNTINSIVDDGKCLHSHPNSVSLIELTQ